MIVLYILLFIVCLSTLVMVHEAGHLIAAKTFKVYCFEYAVGFGPKLFSRKRKNGETYFSIRAIPFGGFVSMYGEQESVPEGLEIDPSRSLLAIKKWRRAIIMAAGVVMNFLLAIVIFFVYEVGFPTYAGRYGHITVAPNSIASNVGLKSKDAVYASVLSYEDNAFIFYDENASITYTDASNKDAYIGFNYNTLTIKDTSLINHAVSYERLTFGNYLIGTDPVVSIASIMTTDYSGTDVAINSVTGFTSGYRYKQDESKNYLVEFAMVHDSGTLDDEYVIAKVTFTEEQFKIFKFVPDNSEVTVSGDIYQEEVDGKIVKYINVQNYSMPYPNLLGKDLFTKKTELGAEPNRIQFSLYVMDDDNPTGRGVATSLGPVELNKVNDIYRLPDNLGLSMQLDVGRNSFGEALGKTFEDFGNSATLIVRGLGSLFTEDGWKNVGGIIAIGVSTTKILQENGFGTFLFYWGLISVNLGIINLLPFPGLDGWHLLVIAIEGIFRKEIPAKVKNVVSAVGVLILFALMILIVAKDIIGLF